MKKILLILLTMIAMTSTFEATAAGPGIIYENDPYCAVWGGTCPLTWMWNRNKTKRLARYQPNSGNYCNTASMSVWIMGHPNNAYGVGFTNNDWQDLEVAKQKSGGYYRWGCCYSSDPYNTICLN